jgi:hypothetical protein
MRAGAVLDAGTAAEGRAWRTCAPLLKGAADVLETIAVETLTSVSTATRAFLILAVHYSISFVCWRRGFVPRC